MATRTRKPRKKRKHMFVEDVRQLPETLNTAQVADWLGFADITIRKWAESGEIPARKRCGRWLFTRDTINEWKGGILP